MRIGPMVIKQKASGFTNRHNATIYHHSLPDSDIGLPAKTLIRATTKPANIKAGVISVWLTALSLTNLKASPRQQTKANKSPIKLGSDQESNNTHPMPIIDRTMATQVIGWGISRKKIQPSMAANRG